MIVKTGLLVLTNPVNFRIILPSINKTVKNTLYIHLTSAISESLGRYKPEIYTSSPKYSKTIRGIYADAAALRSNLDIRVLLSNLKYTSLKTISTSQEVETVIFDRTYEKSQIDTFVNKCTNKKPDCSILVLEDEKNTDLVEKLPENGQKTHKHVVLGGTFDRFHTGHKVLLTEAVLCAEEKVTVGVTDANMTYGKLLWELVEPIDTRIQSIQTYLNDICPELKYNVVPIQDPFGPTQSDPTMNLIVVSAETLKGGEKVNEIRKKNNLNPLEIDSVELLDSHDAQENEEAKISSSNIRLRILGCLLKAPNQNLASRNPYIIGLTGGIASGKSSVAKRLENLGAQIIDCDKIGHEVYKLGKPCHRKIVEAFGTQVLAENGEINRRVLGGIVFADKNELERLNSLVWPSIADEVRAIISSISISSAPRKIVVIDAAVLLPAGWDKFCHEVWSCIIPQDEAIKRIQNRNNLSEEDAKKRIKSQLTNSDIVEKSNVVLCTFWEPDYTQKMVEKAWKLLQARLEDK